MMRELVLMTWNVRYFGHGLKGLRTTRRWMARVAEALASVRALPDIIALQEVETQSIRGGLTTPQLDVFDAMFADRLRDRGTDRRYRSLYFPAHRYGAAQGPALYTTGLAMLVADDIELLADNTHAPHDITHRSDSTFAPLKQTRIVAHARLRRGAGPALDVFNTHLSLPSFSEVGIHRLTRRMGFGTNQVREALNLVKHVEEKESRHAVVVGDFNSAPDTPAYRAMLRAGFADGFASHAEDRGSSADAWCTASFGSSRMHIDHVFSSPDVSWLDFAPYTTRRGGPFHGLSDHVPKLGRLRLEG